MYMTPITYHTRGQLPVCQLTPGRDKRRRGIRAVLWLSILKPNCTSHVPNLTHRQRTEQSSTQN